MVKVESNVRHNITITYSNQSSEVMVEMEVTADPKRKSTPESMFTGWEEKVKSYRLPRTDIDKLVMDYLVKEGFKDAVLAFQAETGLKPGVNMAHMDDQIKIREAIEAGRIQDAVELVNDVDPDILDTNPTLYFHLQQQQLLELIKTGDVERILEYSCTELAARGEENPSFLDELEQSLSLLAFEDPTSSPFAKLLQSSQNLKVVSEMNAALLSSQDQEPMSKLVTLMKLVLWSQEQLKKRGFPFPMLADITDGKLQTVLKQLQSLQTIQS